MARELRKWLASLGTGTLHNPSEPDDDEPDPMRTGFLIVEANFLSDPNPWSVRDVFAFNETFRYWRRPWLGHEVEDRAGYFYNKLVPQSMDGDNPYFDRWAPLLGYPVEINGKSPLALFPGADKGEKWAQDARRWVDTCKGEPGWITYADNRTFVWTCLLVDGGADRLAKGIFRGQDSRGAWIKLLNVDPPYESISCTAYERKWAKSQTYCRWQESGSLYGFSYHSGALLGPPIEKPPLWQNFGDMYFDMTLLLLYLRVCTFRYSTCLTNISGEMRSKCGEKEFVGRFRKLRKSFALFTNLYQFPLLSNQQQGIEMYEIARRSLDVNDLFREMQEEVAETHEYLELKQQQDQTEISLRLTFVATVGLSLRLAISFLGMSIFFDWLHQWAQRHGISILVLDASLFALAILFSFVIIYLALSRADSLRRWLERRLPATGGTRSERNR